MRHRRLPVVATDDSRSRQAPGLSRCRAAPASRRVEPCRRAFPSPASGARPEIDPGEARRTPLSAAKQAKLARESPMGLAAPLRQLSAPETWLGAQELPNDSPPPATVRSGPARARRAETRSTAQTPGRADSAAIAPGDAAWPPVAQLPGC